MNVRPSGTPPTGAVPRRYASAFSLVELAVVMVIIGLLVSGTMAGRELMHLSELKSIISELEYYKVSVDTFKTQYEALPGDIKNATSYWTGGVTADGNNDGKIGTGADNDFTEPFYAWDQLSLAKIIAGTYSGSGTGTVINTNVPASKYINGGGFSISYFATPFSYVDALSRSFPGNYIAIGKNNASKNYMATNALSPADAGSIDKKIDDGSPDYGKMLAGEASGGAGCTTGSAPDIIYDLTSSTVGCVVLVGVE